MEIKDKLWAGISIMKFFSCQQVLVYFRIFKFFLDITHWLTGYVGQLRKRILLQKRKLIPENNYGIYV
jgi:hypothetical protein